MAYKSWQAVWDPHEEKDYVRDWTAQMDADTDTIASPTFTLPAEALSAAMVVYGVGIDASAKKAIFWVRSTNPTTTAAALEGQSIYIDHTIVTVEGRKYNETLVLKIESK